MLANFFVNSFLSFVLLAIFNCETFRTIQTASQNFNMSTNRQKRDYSIAIMLSIVVLVFVLCSIPRIILNTWEVSGRVLSLNISAVKYFKNELQNLV